MGIGVLEIRLHRLERIVQARARDILVAAIERTRGVKPAICVLTLRLLDSGVVALFNFVRLDQILVVKEKLRAKLELRIGEVARPGVSSLIPDLYGFKI